jgi:hypothetical protein
MRPEFDTFQIMRQLQGARQEIAKSLGLRDEACIEQAADEMDQVQAAEARDLAIINQATSSWTPQASEAHEIAPSGLTMSTNQWPD